ncbi:MAG: zf-TFIIB domain-containing protein [Proteobacteria bacterium]|nr:zf-TFIIB domain-containing protein [Pseudomonadota bacterium]
MPFRTRTDLPCPRCGVPLVRYADRDKWRCKRCVGVLLGPAELAVEAPWLLEEAARASTSAQPPCPACAQPMTTIGFENIELDRCDADKVVWFDAAELGLVVEIAHSEADREAELSQLEQQKPLALIQRILADDETP